MPRKDEMDSAAPFDDVRATRLAEHVRCVPAFSERLPETVTTRSKRGTVLSFAGVVVLSTCSFAIPKKTQI